METIYILWKAEMGRKDYSPNKPKSPLKKIGTFITHTMVLYIWSMSDWKTVCITFLLILKAAVTSPDSGVHASGASDIILGISNFSRFDLIPCMPSVFTTA